MRGWRKKSLLKALSREEGVVALEFVLLFPVFVLVILAVLEFGHLWIIRHTLTIATREGARAAVVYIPGTDEYRASEALRIAQERVNTYLGPAGPAKWEPDEFTVPVPTVNPGPGGLTGGTLTVRAQANEPLLVLHKLISPISVVGETTMRFE